MDSLLQQYHDDLKAFRRMLKAESPKRPKSTDPADEIATALNTRPKFVASRTLDKVTWNNLSVLKR